MTLQEIADAAGVDKVTVRNDLAAFENSKADDLPTRIIGKDGKARPAKYTRKAQPPLEGLGTDLKTLKNLCRDDVEAIDAIDRAAKRPVGVHRYGDDVYNVNSSNDDSRPQGHSAQYAIRKLRRDRPDLHTKVLAGELTPHAAMVEAGFRKVKTPLEQLVYWWGKANASSGAPHPVGRRGSATGRTRRRTRGAWRDRQRARDK